MSKSTIESTVDRCDAAGWLDITPGVAWYAGSDARPNSYRITSNGADTLPDLLRDMPSRNPWDLAHPLWAEQGGVGVRGLLVALHASTTEERYQLHELSVADMQETLGISRRAVRGLVERWIQKAPRLFHKFDGRYYMTPLYEGLPLNHVECSCHGHVEGLLHVHARASREASGSPYPVRQVMRNYRSLAALEAYMRDAHGDDAREFTRLDRILAQAHDCEACGGAVARARSRLIDGESGRCQAV